MKEGVSKKMALITAILAEFKNPGNINEYL